VALAPMYKVTDLAFRLLCKEQGAGLVFTEMANSEAIKRNNKATFHMIEVSKDEKPVGIQVFGAKPSVCAEAVQKICEIDKFSDLIDFNLGCPVRHIRQQGAGSALLSRPKRIAETIKAMVGVSDRPISAKIRSLGSSKETVRIAKIIERNGASLLAVHARTIKQMHKGVPDYAVLKEVKSALGIPVIGNGGIFDPESMNAMLENTGCDSVMVGRAAIGNPGVFAELLGRKGIGRIEAFFRYLELANKYDCYHFGRAKLQAIPLKDRFLMEKIERSKEIEEITSALKEAAVHPE
jgi:tRNA-dihydrouridine synthase B